MGPDRTEKAGRKFRSLDLELPDPALDEICLSVGRKFRGSGTSGLPPVQKCVARELPKSCGCPGKVCEGFPHPCKETRFFCCPEVPVLRTPEVPDCLSRPEVLVFYTRRF
uniref:Uncharacterized protein n=1 Tax=Oryza sativa subsp. japonica TaxID=39947 RepID=Q6Z292_ORYSJ|nr:hypothetical protein [Oryza sativa Japonica Group]